MDSKEHDQTSFMDSYPTVPGHVLQWVRTKVGRDACRGFGYLSWVFLAADVVLKVARAVDERDRFAVDEMVSRWDPPVAAVPRVLDRGEIEGHSWVMTTRLDGEPAYLRWLALEESVRRKLTSDLLELLRAFHCLDYRRTALPAAPASWGAAVAQEAARTLEGVRSALPEQYRRACKDRLGEWVGRFEDRRFYLVHGDLWLGNLLVDERGRLSGLLDFDKTRAVPKDFELATMMRFWRFPWSFVPESLEGDYQQPLDHRDVGGIFSYCTDELSWEETVARLSCYELIYRLQKVIEFGWGETQRMMVDAVLDGTWCEYRGLNPRR